MPEWFPELNAATAYLVGGVLVATAIVIFFWRVVRGMTVKNAAILIGLLLFIVAFVLPNLK